MTAGAVTHPPGRTPRYLVPAVLLVLVAAVIAVVALSPRRSNGGSSSTASEARIAAQRHLPAYWTVRPGQTLSEIARRTGLSIDQIQALNPAVDPNDIIPGQRLRLRVVQAAPPRPKPLGPLFWTVRSGESFGSIAFKTHHNIVDLEHLNPRLKPTTLQPGDRVRLRR